MKPKEFQELLDFIAKSGLAEVSIETDAYKVAVKRDSVVGTPVVQTVHAPVAVAAPALPPAAKPKEETKPVSNSEDKYLTIKSPMIGTFYRTANPEMEPFVNIGDMISKGQTVCIIEAMKLFNEIESDLSGRIVKILVENATPVEYDQPLFLVDPS
ncbi:MAG TPA: acetyl-CoA carboxylase biotin carboxyl carrier protein [Cytophagales bacterium]|jgi:acetyl-CoA carboxylase biotin carboxyl carrier protein|nr:acetyl-CoA carboxylase biotin carboxyl carrier protein [Cytophagales bacterium]